MVGLKINNMKQYITPLLRAATVLVLLYTIYEQHNIIDTQNKRVVELTYKIDNIDSIQSIKLDSLQSELFIQKTIVGRYELGIDYLKERNLKEYLVVKHFIESQTE